MSPTLLAALGAVAVGLLLAAARLLRWPSSLVLLAGGVACSFLPGLPDGRALSPAILLGLVLPVLLYVAVVETSTDLLRHAGWHGLPLGVLLQFGVVGAAALALTALAGLPVGTALVLALVLSMTDPKLAEELGHARRVPRRLTDALATWGLAAPLVLITLAAEVGAGGAIPGPGAVALALGRDWLLGGAAGAALGLLSVALRRRLDAAPAEVAVSLATPLAASALAGAADWSVAPMVIAAGLVVSRATVDPRSGATLSDPRARLVAAGTWSELRTVLPGALAFLTGFALADALADIGWTRAAALLPAVLLALLVGFAATLAAALVAARGKWRPALALALLPSAAPLGLLIALAIPATEPGEAASRVRDLALVAATSAIVLSSVWCVTTIGPLIVRLGVDARGERDAEAHRATEVAAAPAVVLEQLRLAVLRLRRADAIGDADAREGQHALDAAALWRATLSRRHPG